MGAGQHQITIEFTNLAKMLTMLDTYKQYVLNQIRIYVKDCSLEYVQQVKDKIIGQNFHYPALDDTYAEWKAKHYPAAKTFWHLAGDLQKAVASVNLRTSGNSFRYAGTIPAGLMDSGGKSYWRTSATEILTYARVLEYGYKNIPARPLFTPVGEAYFKDSLPKQLEKIRKKMIKRWRI